MQRGPWSQPAHLQFVYSSSDSSPSNSKGPNPPAFVNWLLALIPAPSKVLGEFQSCQLLSDCSHGWKDARVLLCSISNRSLEPAVQGPGWQGTTRGQHSLEGAVNTQGAVPEGSAAVWAPAPWNRNCLGSPVSAPCAHTGVAVLG